MERVVIIGSGLVGSLLAVYVARRGHQVDVFERQDPRRRSRVLGADGAHSAVRRSLNVKAKLESREMDRYIHEAFGGAESASGVVS